MVQTVSGLTAGDLDRIARLLARVDALIAEHLGRGLLDDDSDLDAVQGLLDGGEVTHAHDLQSLGLVVGQRLVAAIAGLGWVAVEDEHGRDPALRLGDSARLLLPLDLIVAPVARGEAITVRALFAQLCAELDDAATAIPSEPS